jgi:cytochrome c oxidase assembly factor CtaG
MAVESFFGLPAHPLLVHIPTVLVPLAGIGVIAMAVRRSLLRAFGGVVAVLAAGGFFGVVLAASSGEALQADLLEAGQTVSPTLQDHADLGGSARWIVGAFALATIAWVLVERWRRRSTDERPEGAKKARALAAALLALTLVTAAGATYSVVRAGHSGASSVWDTGL